MKRDENNTVKAEQRTREKGHVINLEIGEPI